MKSGFVRMTAAVIVGMALLLGLLRVYRAIPVETRKSPP